MHRELNEIDEAIDDTVRAMHIFRAISDDEIDVPETPWSKLQWGESLAEVTRLYLAKGKLKEGFDFFRKQIDFPYQEDDANNRSRLFDLLFGYSQYIEFVAKFAQNESGGNAAEEELRHVIDSAIEIANRGIEIVKKVCPPISEIDKKIIIDGIELNKIDQDQDKIDQNKVDQNKVDQDKIDQDKIDRNEVDRGNDDVVGIGEGVINDPLVRLFFLMKYTYFHQLRGSLYQDIGDVDFAVRNYEVAFNGWMTLIVDLDKLFLQRQYYVRELEAMRAMEAERQLDGNYFESVKAMAEIERRVQPSDFFEERWRYYVSELRGTLQRWALLELSVGRVNRAGMVYRLDINLARDMVRRNITNADRYLVVSLLAYAKAMEVSGKVDDSLQAFTEVLDLILSRLSLLDCCLEDYEMLRHIMLAFSSFLVRSNLLDRVYDVLNLYIESIEKFRLPLPDWQQWQELCSLPNIKPHIDEFKQRCDNLLKKHPTGK
jgi:tetratricopeptide (TPR) repeat protein